MTSHAALKAAIKTLADRLRASSAVIAGQDVLTRYDAAGGGLLAGGLTYAALFALLPCLLLLSGVLGLVIEDPARQRDIVTSIGENLPPLRGLFAASLASLADGAVGFGAIGLLGFAWGASRFYGSLDDAFARIFTNAPKRGFFIRLARGVAAIGLFVLVLLLALAISGAGTYLLDQAAGRFGLTSLLWVVTPVLTAAIFIGTVAILYRMLPACYVPWRTLRLPAAVIGVALAALTQIFSVIAPRLIGSAAIFGTFIAVFAAMIWLSLGFQVLLLGASWVSERLDRPLTDTRPAGQATLLRRASTKVATDRPPKRLRRR